MTKIRMWALVSVERITESILIVRGQRVLLDSQFAELYGVATKRFNEQVKRNLARSLPAAARTRASAFLFRTSTPQSARTARLRCGTAGAAPPLESVRWASVADAVQQPDPRWIRPDDRGHARKEIRAR
jgi:hypothetical protein